VKTNGHSPTGDKPREEERGRRKGVLGWLMRIKPLAWLIIIGDGIHNFADGLALGAAISQSLTLGVSTTIALVLHEIPHEFGDYVILLSTGLTWYSALLFNFVSALTAVVGFFVGVGAGSASAEVNAWILAFAAGLFIYIALVDLLPELIHSKEKGRHRWGLFLAANLGFLLSFLALFLLAVYEETLNSLLG
jgi:zinc transporter ZupT